MNIDGSRLWCGLVVGLLWAGTVSGHPVGGEAGLSGHTHAEVSTPTRLWRVVATGEVIRGRFLAFRGDVIQIEREGEGPGGTVVGEVLSIHVPDLSEEDRAAAQKEIDRVIAINHELPVVNLASEAGGGASTRPAAAVPFERFAPAVRTRWDERYLYVESDAMPGHEMMVGIRAWQQQVPLPQLYFGDNAWRIPLVPVVAAIPVSAKDQLFRGAIALAANGVPIFNPIKNDGKTDTFLAGELDEFGGHSGRADDYHYHIAPLHLQKTLGPDLPIAYALDGYPIYGLLGERGCVIAGDVKLDGFNGHADARGERYHYHASKTYPYINGGMHGEVRIADGQIDPQPRAGPVRPATSPLRGARITGFKQLAERRWQIRYSVGEQEYVLTYGLDKDGTAVFEVVGPDGGKTSNTYPARRGEDRGAKPPADRSAAPPLEGKPPRPGRDVPPSGDRGSPPRKPWMLVHAPEMDGDHDGVLTLKELEAEIESTFAAYDQDVDGKVTEEETRTAVRSALGGFVKQHFRELAGGNAATRDDLRRVVQRMFDKLDLNGDAKLTEDELKDR